MMRRSAGVIVLLLLMATGLKHPEQAAGATPAQESPLSADATRVGNGTADKAGELENLLQRTTQLARAGRYAEAEETAKQAIAFAERHRPPNDPGLALALNNLGSVYHAQSHYAEAEPFLKQGLEIRERALPADHPDIANSLSSLAVLYADQGRYREAEPLYKRTLAIRERALPADHPDLAESANNLGELYRRQGRFIEAEPFLKQGLEIRERALSADHPDIANSLNNLAVLYFDLGRYSAAAPLFKRALDIRMNSLPLGHPDVAGSARNLAELYMSQGRSAEAERLLQLALMIQEKAMPADRPDLAASLRTLADLYALQGRYAEAESLYKRSLAIYERALPADDPDLTYDLRRLAALYRITRRYAEAEPLLRRALGIQEKALSADHPDIAFTFGDLADLYADQGRYAEAEPFSQLALVILQRALSADHPDVARALQNLALLYQRKGRYAEAEPLFQRALAIQEKALPADHPEIAVAVENVAETAWLQGLANVALDNYRRASAMRTASVNRPSIARHRWTFYWHASTALAASVISGSAEELVSEAFVASQWPQQGAAAQALAQMGARTGARDPELAELVRRREDRLEEHRRMNAALIAALGKADDRRDPTRIAGLRQEAHRLSTELQAVDEELRTRFPNYTELASPQPLAVERAQAMLGKDEVLVTFLLGAAQDFAFVVPKSFVFVVDRKGIYWGELPDRETLAEEVKALRGGLDPRGAVRGGSHSGDQGRTSFDLALAHRLYKELLGHVETHLKDKRHWIVVPDGSLTVLPLQVLVTAPPQAARDETTAYRQAAWLIRDHTLTVLPAVSSLRVLRELRKDQKPAPEPFIGFGDPVIGSKGPMACTEPSAPVLAAMDPSKMPAGEMPVRSAAGVESDSLFRSGTVFDGVLVADVELVRALERLADTRCELEGLARQLGAPPTTVHVAEAATETAVKGLSDTGELARYRLVAFATHGLTASEGGGMRKGLDTELKPLLVAAGPSRADAEEVKAEPALVLTPPKQGTLADDGLLSASEVAALKLNAEWVLLSACNTAGGDKPGAESLSGLAKAFFYAGADSLLVSHWPVYSDAAVQLTTGAIQALAAEPGIGRAEALRRSMLAFLDPQQPSRDAHPRRWAPFTLVGEGQPEPGRK